jgi:hypothetical protein
MPSGKPLQSRSWLERVSIAEWVRLQSALKLPSCPYIVVGVESTTRAQKPEGARAQARSAGGGAGDY